MPAQSPSTATLQNINLFTIIRPVHCTLLLISEKYILFLKSDSYRSKMCRKIWCESPFQKKKILTKKGPRGSYERDHNIGMQHMHDLNRENWSAWYDIQYRTKLLYSGTGVDLDLCHVGSDSSEYVCKILAMSSFVSPTSFTSRIVSAHDPGAFY